MQIFSLNGSKKKHEGEKKMNEKFLIKTFSFWMLTGKKLMETKEGCVMTSVRDNRKC